jgi:DNA-binding transcriptional MerR regulator
MDDTETGLLPIGRFASLCGLSVVTLRHYAEVGVLRPAWTDDDSGYRYYRPSQVHTASTIKLLRALQLSLPQVAELLQAPRPAARSAVEAHLAQLERQHLDRTRTAAYVLSRLIPEEPLMTFPVRTQPEPARVVLMRSKHVMIAELGPFLEAAFAELSAQAAEQGLHVEPGAAFTRFHDPVDEEHTGTVDACLTVVAAEGAPGTTTLPPALAAATDVYDDDATYPRLLSAYDAVARWAGEHGHDLVEPAREYYRARRLQGDAQDHIEIVWPVSR